MPSEQDGYTPGLSVFLKSLKHSSVDASIESLISLLKRRQIKSSRPCAVATAHLLLRVVAKFKWTDVERLLDRIKEVGRCLINAQPREMVVGNIVRRVLGMIRDEAREDRVDDTSDSTSNSRLSSPRSTSIDADHRNEMSTPTLNSVRRRVTETFLLPTETNVCETVVARSQATSRPPLMTSHTSYAVLNGVPAQQSMFNLLSAVPSPSASPQGSDSPQGRATVNSPSLAQRISTTTTEDLKAEIISGIEEIIDELDQVDEQIAAYAQEHIHSNEVILTHSSSLSVQKFLLKAAEKRRFTLIVAESYPNDHQATHSAATGKVNHNLIKEDDTSLEFFLKPLSNAGITVILMTDASIFAIMSRINKVILTTHAVIANGGLIAAAGARLIAKAAKVHRTPVIVVSGVYKLSPEYPFEFDSSIEYGNPGNIVGFENGTLVENLEIDNPVYDYVPPELVDLYITNLGAHAPSYLYRIVADHYKTEDTNFHKLELQF